MKLADNKMSIDESTAVVTVGKASTAGIKVDLATPTYPWQDIIGFIRPKATGAGTPAAAVFHGGQYLAYAFAANDKCSIEFHIPHDYVLGTNLFIHLHWAHNGTAISGSLVVDCYSSYSKGHNQANFTAELTTTITVSTPDIATIPQYRHRIDEVQLSTSGGSGSLLDTDLIEPDGLILMAIKPTTIPTITGGTPNAPYILFADLHYQSTGIGTKQKTPDFYV